MSHITSTAVEINCPLHPLPSFSNKRDISIALRRSQLFIFLPLLIFILPFDWALCHCWKGSLPSRSPRRCRRSRTLTMVWNSVQESFAHFKPTSTTTTRVRWWWYFHDQYLHHMSLRSGREPRSQVVESGPRQSGPALEWESTKDAVVAHVRGQEEKCLLCANR